MEVITGLTHISIYVKDWDEALRWYSEVFGLEVRNNVEYGPGYRWVTVGAPGQTTEIVLHRAEPGSDMAAVVGKQFGTVFGTDDCRGDVERLRGRGVRILTEPEDQMWGTQAVVADLYGNSHVLVQPPAR